MSVQKVAEEPKRLEKRSEKKGEEFSAAVHRRSGSGRLLTPDQAAAQQILRASADMVAGTPATAVAAPEHRISKAKSRDEVNEDLKSRPDYSEEVQLRLTNLIYDPLATMLFENAGIHPDEAHLLSLTRINSSREAAAWAQQITREAIYNIYVNRHKCDWAPSQIWRVAFLLARRSIAGTCGPGFMLGVGLAQEQSITKQEEPSEEKEW